MENTTLQWHPAFYAGMQIELMKESDNLIFENEDQLGTKPKEIDVLIIKKDSDKPIKKNIGQIFRKHNIVEYKSPADYLSIDDFYHVYAYACFYKTDTAKENQILAEDISISFVCSKYPRKLMKYLKTKRKYRVRYIESGIYYIEGDFFPMQIICTSRLTDEENFWLHNLTNELGTKEQAMQVMHRYENHTNENLYESIVNVIINANSETFKEVSGMCEALERIYDETLGEKYRKMYDEKYSKLYDEKYSKLYDEKYSKLYDEKYSKLYDEKYSKLYDEKYQEMVAKKEAELKQKDAYILELEKKLAMQTA